MPDRSFLDRFEEYLTDEADEFTANTWTPFLAARVPQLLHRPGTDRHLRVLLWDLRNVGLTPRRMHWAAREARRAEQEGLAQLPEEARLKNRRPGRN